MKRLMMGILIAFMLLTVSAVALMGAVGEGETEGRAYTRGTVNYTTDHGIVGQKYNDFEFYGLNYSSSVVQYGYSMASGDINGDGYDDVVFGDPWTSSVQIMLTTPSQPFLNRTFNEWPPSGANITLWSVTNYGMLGTQVLVGNIDGDAYADLIVVAGQTDPGAVFVIRGKDLYMAVGWTEIYSISSAIYQCDSNPVFDWSNFCKATLGDLDGDGLDDMLFAIPNADLDFGGGPLSDAGIVYGMFGKALWTDIATDSRDFHMMNTHPGNPGADFALFAYNGNGWHFGWDVEIGDIDADGSGEIMVVVSKNGDPWQDHIVQVIAGQTKPYWSSSGYSNPNTITLFNISSSEGLGCDGVISYDVDGDLRDDIIIGVQDEVNDRYQSNIFYGSGKEFFENQYYVSEEGFANVTIYNGSIVNFTGDINNDGYNDLIVTNGTHMGLGGSGSPGIAGLILGGPSMNPFYYDHDVTFYGNESYFGLEAIDADLDNDDHSDLLITHYRPLEYGLVSGWKGSRVTSDIGGGGPSFDYTTQLRFEPYASPAGVGLAGSGENYSVELTLDSNAYTSEKASYTLNISTSTQTMLLDFTDGHLISTWGGIDNVVFDYHTCNKIVNASEVRYIENVNFKFTEDFDLQEAILARVYVDWNSVQHETGIEQCMVANQASLWGDYVVKVEGGSTLTNGSVVMPGAQINFTGPKWHYDTTWFAASWLPYLPQNLRDYELYDSMGNSWVVNNTNDLNLTITMPTTPGTYIFKVRFPEGHPFKGKEMYVQDKVFVLNVPSSGVIFNNFIPTEWQDNGEVDISVTMSAVDGMLDLTTLKYKTWLDGDTEPSTWNSIAMTGNASTYTASAGISFKEGKNIILFNITLEGSSVGVTSQEFYVKVDVSAPFFQNPQPSAAVPQALNNVTVSVDVKDNGSGADPTTVQFAYKTNGTSTFSSWSTTGISVQDLGDKVAASIDLWLPNGKNWVKWRAKDVLGNGWGVSAVYEINVDTSQSGNKAPVVVIKSPKHDDIYSTASNIYFSVEGTYDPDGDPLSYHWSSSISGFLSSHSTFSRSLPEGTHNITLAVNDGNGHNVSKTNTIYVLKPSEEPDTDNDTIPDNLDTDDDNDGIPDETEKELGYDPKNASSAPTVFEEVSLHCPCNLMIEDNTGASVGFDKSGSIIPDDLDGRAKKYIFGDQEDYLIDNPGFLTYTVFGTGDGTYNLEITRTNIPGKWTKTVSFDDIPIKNGEVHEYTIDWDKVGAGGTAAKDLPVTFKQDEDGDNTFETVVNFDENVGTEEYSEGITDGPSTDGGDGGSEATDLIKENLAWIIMGAALVVVVVIIIVIVVFMAVGKKEDPGEKSSKGVFDFDCPKCGALVYSDETNCYRCGEILIPHRDKLILEYGDSLYEDSLYEEEEEWGREEYTDYERAPKAGEDDFSDGDDFYDAAPRKREKEYDDYDERDYYDDDYYDDYDDEYDDDYDDDDDYEDEWD